MQNDATVRDAIGEPEWQEGAGGLLLDAETLP
jgi:hypothetical protein